MVTQGSVKTAHAVAEDANASDAALVERLTQGDSEALTELYGRHAASLLALALRILQDRQESEDLLHDVFLEAWQHCAEYSEARSTVRAWLLMRTRSRALDRLRARTRRRDNAENLARAQTSEQASDPQPSLAARRLLPAALARIPETQQDVIVLSYFEGLSTLEISSRLGIPAGTVKSRTHAAIATLRLVLGVVDD